VDQRADAGDQQDEHHRQRIEQHARVDLETADRDPAEQMQADLASRAGLGLHREEQHDAVDEQDHRYERAEHVAPLVGSLAAEQQHAGRDRGDRDEQPGGRLDAVSSGHDATQPGRPFGTTITACS
jgi:hypothetical protein